MIAKVPFPTSVAMKGCRSLSFVILTLLNGIFSVSMARAQSPLPTASDSLAQRFSQMELLFCFQGKGSCLPYDGGVLHEAYERIPALR